MSLSLLPLWGWISFLLLEGNPEMYQTLLRPIQVGVFWSSWIFPSTHIFWRQCIKCPGTNWYLTTYCIWYRYNMYIVILINNADTQMQKVHMIWCFFVYIARYLHAEKHWPWMVSEATDGMDPPVDAKPIMDTSSALPGNRLAGGDTEEDRREFTPRFLVYPNPAVGSVGRDWISRWLRFKHSS